MLVGSKLNGKSNKMFNKMIVPVKYVGGKLMRTAINRATNGLINNIEKAIKSPLEKR